MTEHQQLVREFNQAVSSPRSAELRANLILEEGQETIEAIKSKDPVALIDGLCDLLYVTYGAGDTFDLTLSTPHVFYDPAIKPMGWKHIEGELDMFEKSVEKSVEVLLALEEPGELYQVKHFLENLANRCWIMASIGLGLDLRPFFKEVHRANMEKLTGPKREDGKQLKPEGWQPPRIAEMYAELGEREL